MIVYTAIFGGYDKPLKPNFAGSCPHVLFTDHEMEAPGWEVRVVAREFGNPARENRYYKMHPHKLFPKKRTIYHDGGMRLNMYPVDILKRFQVMAGGDHSVFTLKHSLGHTMRQEFEWVRRKGIVLPSVLDEQWARYEVEGAPFDDPVAEARLLVSRPDASRFYGVWWEEVRQYAHRDQVSFAYARWRTKADVCLIEEPNWRALFSHKPHRKTQLRGAI